MTAWRFLHGNHSELQLYFSELHCAMTLFLAATWRRFMVCARLREKTESELNYEQLRNDTGIQDHSHVGGSSGSLWLVMAASRSLAKPSSSVTGDLCLRAKRSDSDNKRTEASAGWTTAKARKSSSMTISS